MITFVSYKPGARGKFLAELCDLSMIGVDKLPDSLYRHDHESSGQVQWTKALIPYFEKINLHVGNIHGIFPESENYRQYIDLVTSGLSEFTNSNFTIDTHYIEEETLQYILDSGHRVIRIVVTSQLDAEKLQNMFYYKNFIAPRPADYADDQQKIELARRILDENYNNSQSWVPKHLIETAYKSCHLNFPDWPLEALTVLYKCCGGLARRLQKKNAIVHENLFEIELPNVLNFDQISNVINFVGGHVNDDVIARFDRYKNEQDKIRPFKEYIKDFAKC